MKAQFTVLSSLQSSYSVKLEETLINHCLNKVKEFRTVQKVRRHFLIMLESVLFHGSFQRESVLRRHRRRQVPQLLDIAVHVSEGIDGLDVRIHKVAGPTSLQTAHGEDAHRLYVSSDFLHRCSTTSWHTSVSFCASLCMWCVWRVRCVRAV